MKTPDTERKARLKKLLDDGDQQYNAELKRQNEIANEENNSTPVIKQPLADLEKS